MKRHKFLFGLLMSGLFLFTMCTPKTANKTSSTPEDFRKHAPEAGPAPQIKIGKYDLFSMANGLKVIVVENHKLPQVSFQVFVDAPPVQEGEAAGFVSMAGDMLSRGTTSRTKAEIDEAVDFIGASFSSGASGLYGSCLTKHKEALLEIMSDVLLHPSFPREEFEKLKKQTLSGLAQAKTDPNTIANNVSSVLNYGKDHPYGEVQTEESTEKISLDLCKNYYNTFFKPNISYLVVVGDINAAEAKELAEKYFADWKDGDVPALQYKDPQPPSSARVCFVDKPGAVQSVINVTYPVEFTPGNPDAMPARVMNTIFGGYFRSRLNDNLREDKAYTYGARSYLSSDPLIGEFKAYASVRNEVTDSSLVQFLYEMNRLRTEPVGEEELRLVKNYLSGSFGRSLERPQTIARFALNIARYHLPENYYETYLERLEAVTAEQVMAMAQKYLHPDKAYLLVVGNKGEVAGKLSPFDSDGTIEFYDAFGNPVQASAGEVPAGMTAEKVIENYLQAIGGKDKLASIKNADMYMGTAMGGMQLELRRVVVLPDKFYFTVNMGDQVVQMQLVNGDKGVIGNMGQTQPMDEETLAEVKKEITLFDETKYLGDNYQLALDGMEMVDGKPAYQITVTHPNGDKTVLYFDKASGLKLREVEFQDVGTGEPVPVVQNFSDYREVAPGIMMPFKLQIAGAGPQPMELTMMNIILNEEIDDALFEIK